MANPQPKPTASTTSSTSKKPRHERKESGYTALATQVGKLHPVLEMTSSSIEKMVNSLCYDDGLIFPSGNLYNELSLLDGLDSEQVMDASLLLAKDHRDAQIYYQLPNEEDKLNFIMMLIN